MTAESTHSPGATRLERTYGAPPELIWELWTTAVGLDQWFAPDGFESRVTELELRPGGRLRYSMTATAPEQVAFMVDTGNPLSIEVTKTFTEVIAAPSSTTWERRSGGACLRSCRTHSRPRGYSPARCSSIVPTTAGSPASAGSASRRSACRSRKAVSSGRGSVSSPRRCA
jgi:hypothetical protein